MAVSDWISKLKIKAKKYEILASLTTAIIVVSIDIALLIFKGADIPGAKASRTITQVIIIIVIALFLTGIFQLLIKTKALSSFAGSIPNHLTTIGILGTFSGIFIGLYFFDVNNLKNSVPLLLEGMKVAFATSIAGLVSSTGLKVTHSFVISISEDNDPFMDTGSIFNVETVSNEVTTILREINNNLNKLNLTKFILDLIEKLSGGDKVLVSESLEDKIEDLIDAIDSLETKISDISEYINKSDQNNIDK
jgi:hypothetical protein